MKQNKNKNITKITSGALVLLLASGCYIGNSNADSNSEGSVIEDKDMKISGTISESKKENTISGALYAVSKTTENNDVNTSENNENLGSSLSDEGSVAELTGEKVEEKEDLNSVNSSNDSNQTNSSVKKEDENKDKAVNKPSQSDKEEKQKEVENVDNKSNKSEGENKDKPVDKNKVEEESENPNTNPKKENKVTNTDSNNTSKSIQNKTEVQTVPGQGDDQDSKKLKNKIAGEINGIKALVNDGTWSEESVKAAKAKITNLEAFLLKGDLKDKDLAEVKSALNDIQINVLKKKIVKETNVVKNDDKKVVSNEKSNKLSQKTVIKSNTDNVQTGVGSLSSVLLTLGSSSLALFAGKKRK